MDYDELDFDFDDLIWDADADWKGNFANLDLCRDCLGVGLIVLFNSQGKCHECDGSGWVAQGAGIGLQEAMQRGLLK